MHKLAIAATGIIAVNHNRRIYFYQKTDGGCHFLNSFLGRTVALSPDGRYFAIVRHVSNNLVFHIGSPTSFVIKHLNSDDFSCVDISFSVDGTYFAAAGYSNDDDNRAVVKIWKTDAIHLLNENQPHVVWMSQDTTIYACDITPYLNGFCFRAFNNIHLRFINSDSGEVTLLETACSKFICCPNEPYVATYSQRLRMCDLNLYNTSLLTSGERVIRDVNDMAFSPDGKYLTVTRSNELTTFSTDRFNVVGVQEFSDDYENMAYSPDGNFLALLTLVPVGRPPILQLFTTIKSETADARHALVQSAKRRYYRLDNLPLKHVLKYLPDRITRRRIARVVVGEEQNTGDVPLRF